MKKLHLVYDFADKLPRFQFMFLPLLFVFIGIGILVYHKKYVDPRSTTWLGDDKRTNGMASGFLMTLISSIIFIALTILMLREYFNTKGIYNEKKYLTVEGEVQNFHPMPSTGHDTENFDVSGVHFEFSDYDVSDYGYNNAASKGGAIKEGLFVKICYYEKGDKNIILILETE